MKTLLIVLLLSTIYVALFAGLIFITGCASKHIKHNQGCFEKYAEGFKDGKWLGYQVGILEGEQNCSEKK